MKLTRNRLIAGALGLAALGFGVVGVQAATSPSSNGKNYAQVFVDKLAGILHLSSSQTQNDLKQAELQQSRVRVDQLCRVRETAKRSGFAASPLQSRLAFFLRQHDLRVDLLQVAGKSDVL